MSFWTCLDLSFWTCLDLDEFMGQAPLEPVFFRALFPSGFYVYTKADSPPNP